MAFWLTRDFQEANYSRVDLVYQGKGATSCVHTGGQGRSEGKGYLLSIPVLLVRSLA